MWSRIKHWFVKHKAVRYIALSFLAILILFGGLYTLLYISTPQHIRKPAYQHYHFRTQIIVDGKPVDFAEDKFQEEKAAATSCSIAVGGVPIDFHDKMDQLTHVHWAGMTGGEFMKDYGWNYIGGPDNTLGYRFDTGIKPRSVPIYGKLLPAVPDNATFFIYTGDKDNYQQKNWQDFLNQDLETFFGKQSNVGHSEEITKKSLGDWLFPKVYAHGEVVDEHDSEKSEEELTRINNLIGNVVIFAQENEPTKEEIQARFNDLVPLHDSTCGE